MALDMKTNYTSIKVWDIFIRLFHWTLVVVIINQYLTGDRIKHVHVNSGYFLIGLLLARILWGFVGSKHAKFSDFLYGPNAIINYLKGLIKGKPKHYIGHNPAGGLMIFIMLFTLLVTAFTGLKTLGSRGQGPLADQGISMVLITYAVVDKQNDNDHKSSIKEHVQKNEKYEFWKEIHEAMTGFMIFLIIVHIGGVIVSSWVHKENLILAMITGKKKKE
jgi:cytochrome b